MSDLRRFFLPRITQPLTICDEEFRHAVNVLRIKENERIIVCDNSGLEYICNVDKINKKNMELSVLDKRQSNVEANSFVTLFAGYLKGDKTELVVQKAVELGVKEIVVFNSQYCSAFMNENKLARLNKVSVESAKQCGRAIAPPVRYIDNFEGVLKEGEKFDNKLFACEFATESQVDLTKPLFGSTAIVVGSEGGFSQEESDLTKQYGYQTVFLGKRILRAETACISLCAIVMNCLGELK